MKINWKVRKNNPMFWIQLFLSVAVPVGAYFGITGQDMTSWLTLWNVIVDAISNPYVLFTVAVSVYNTLVDPTTPGVSDSKQALTYDEPGKELK